MFDAAICGCDAEFLRYRIAKGDTCLTADGRWKAGERVEVPRNSVVLLTTRNVDVAAARDKKIRKVNVNGLDSGPKRR